MAKLSSLLINLNSISITNQQLEEYEIVKPKIEISEKIPWYFYELPIVTLFEIANNHFELDQFDTSLIIYGIILDKIENDTDNKILQKDKIKVNALV